MGLGAWLEKKIAGTPSPEKIKREQDLKKELDEIRWKAHVEREKKKAMTQSPYFSERVLTGLGKAGEVSGKMSRGAFDVLSGGNIDFTPAKTSADFDAVDPLVFSVSKRKRKHHKSNRVTVNVYAGHRRKR